MTRCICASACTRPHLEHALLNSWAVDGRWAMRLHVATILQHRDAQGCGDGGFCSGGSPGLLWASVEKVRSL